MFREMWRLLRDFVREFLGTLIRGIVDHWKGFLVFCGVAAIAMVLLVVVVLKATASPKFCGAYLLRDC